MSKSPPVPSIPLGQPFNIPEFKTTITTTEGTSLRDYFATNAMRAAIGVDMPHSEVGMLDCARYAYSMADAMLKVREENQ